MRKPDSILIEGRSYNWQRLCALRRAQLEAWRASQGQQIALFELKDDCRPKSERCAEGRYSEPTMLDLMRSGGGR
jgi:hypothetical protein